jgi:hypothetical protein
LIRFTFAFGLHYVFGFIWLHFCFERRTASSLACCINSSGTNPNGNTGQHPDAKKKARVLDAGRIRILGEASKLLVLKEHIKAIADKSKSIDDITRAQIIDALSRFDTLYGTIILTAQLVSFEKLTIESFQQDVATSKKSDESYRTELVASSEAVAIRLQPSREPDLVQIAEAEARNLAAGYTSTHPHSVSQTTNSESYTQNESIENSTITTVEVGHDDQSLDTLTLLEEKKDKSPSVKLPELNDTESLSYYKKIFERFNAPENGQFVVAKTNFIYKMCRIIDQAFHLRQQLNPDHFVQILNDFFCVISSLGYAYKMVLAIESMKASNLADTLASASNKSYGSILYVLDETEESEEQTHPRDLLMYMDKLKVAMHRSNTKYECDAQPDKIKSKEILAFVKIPRPMKNLAMNMLGLVIVMKVMSEAKMKKAFSSIHAEELWTVVERLIKGFDSSYIIDESTTILSFVNSIVRPGLKNKHTANDAVKAACHILSRLVLEDSKVLALFGKAQSNTINGGNVSGEDYCSRVSDVHLDRRKRMVGCFLISLLSEEILNRTSDEDFPSSSFTWSLLLCAPSVIGTTLYRQVKAPETPFFTKKKFHEKGSLVVEKMKKELAKNSKATSGKLSMIFDRAEQIDCMVRLLSNLGEDI